MARRALQNWTSWTDFETAQFWETVQANPHAAFEYITSSMNCKGLINPSEPTCKGLSGGTNAISRGPMAMVMTDVEVDAVFQQVKARRLQ